MRMNAWTVVAVLVIVAMMGTPSLAQEGRYEEKHSFKAPFPVVRGSYLASWEFGGSAVVTEEYVRLTPAIKSRTGSIWNVAPVASHDWEVVLEFRIGGGGKLGADGLAFWYTADSRQEGPVFGSKDKWSGLGVFFDTFDNDGMRDNPQISVVVNDGNSEWREDGKHLQAGGCHAQFRNPYRNIKVKIRHVQDMLDVHIDTGTNTWEPCATAMAAALPVNYYFGMTAATGGLFDNHDVYAFETYNLDSGNNDGGYEAQADKAAPAQAAPQTTTPQQQQQQQQQQDNQPPAEKKDERFGDILNKLNNIGQEGQQQPPKQNQATTQQPPAQQQQQQQPPAQQQQQQPPAQQQQQQQPPAQQAPASPQYATPSSDAATLKEIVATLADLSKRVDKLGQVQGTETGGSDKNIEQILSQQKVIAEAFGNLLQSVALKSEIEEIKTQATNNYNTFVKELSDTKAILNDIKATVNTKVSTRNEDIIRTLEDVNQNVNQLKKGVEQTKESTKQIAGNMQQSQQDITSTIEKHTTFGFWSYFLFVQAIFIFGFIWWKKHRDDSNKKLL